MDKASKANISDTQTATFDFGDLPVVWQHRTWGQAPRPEVSLGRHPLRRQGHAQGSVMGYDFTPSATAKPIHRSDVYELEQYPRRQDRKGPRKARRPGHPRPHEGFARLRSQRRGKPVADIEQGYISTTSCILANLSMKLGRR